VVFETLLVGLIALALLLVCPLAFFRFRGLAAPPSSPRSSKQRAPLPTKRKETPTALAIPVVYCALDRCSLDSQPLFPTYLIRPLVQGKQLPPGRKKRFLFRCTPSSFPCRTIRADPFDFPPFPPFIIKRPLVAVVLIPFFFPVCWNPPLSFFLSAFHTFFLPYFANSLLA